MEIFKVSVYQMTLLLLFNESDNLQVEQMQDKTQIEKELFPQILLTLLKSKVLISVSNQS